jgi:hypothetical protein
VKALNLPFLKKWILALCLGIAYFFCSAFPSAGQCGNTLGSRSYDTLVTGPGYGTYSVSFPKWNPDSGALISVKISAIVSLQYSFTLKNADLMPSLYTINVGRYDQISSPAMSSMYTNITEQSIGAYALNPGASVSRPPFSFLANYANIDSITDQVAPFVGTGSLSFVYAPITYTDVHTNNNASYSFAAAATDSIHFSVSYQYCSIGLLASSLIRFAAVLQDPSTVQLSWTMANEQGGRHYEVQESTDGLNFTSVGELSSVTGGTGTMDYQFPWSLPTATQHKWFFRLKIDAVDGRSSYSDIKLVTMGTSDGGGLSVYPNPASNFVNIGFDGVARDAGSAGRNGATGAPAGDWQVDLFSADGRLLQRELYSRVHSVRLNFRQSLARGTYFLRATDRVTNQIYTSSFLVR